MQIYFGQINVIVVTFSSISSSGRCHRLPLMMLSARISVARHHKTVTPICHLLILMTMTQCRYNVCRISFSAVYNQLTFNSDTLERLF